VFELGWIILAAPLLAFLVVGLFGRWFKEYCGWVVVGSFVAAFAVSLLLLVTGLQGGMIGGTFETQHAPLVVWVPGVDVDPGPNVTLQGEIAFRMQFDNLSLVMLTLVSFLAILIATYSVGYMAHEEGKPRFFAEIALFVTGMLGTVSADNFLQLLIFWEIMGLCSYLLIGFWYHKPEAASAAKKAFMVTRIGDLLFLVGVIAIFAIFGTFEFEKIREEMPALGLAGSVTPELLGLLALLLFGGAVGKSAQFPLHFWLPDAMEGPTPVSALIHAATMVKAGVFLVAKSFLFLVPTYPHEYLPDPSVAGHVIEYLVPWNAILVVAAIGGFTAIFAASMALAHYDIKRVLAYSTISQLAYMILGLGAGAWLMAHAGGDPQTAGYTAALFHLMNHAFFKALLFLAAGSVIHAVHTNDMRSMGGLRKHLPWTYRTMLIGSLALAGIPPLSGFWSKDEILAVTFENGASHPGFYLLYVFGILTAFMTAFYSFRLIFMTFHGEYRGAHPEKLHESPWVMVGPLVVLMGFSVLSGILPFFTNGWGNLVFYGHPHAEFPTEPFTHVTTLVLAVISILAAVGGVVLAYLVYDKRRIPAAVFTATESRRGMHTALLNRYYIDPAADRVGRDGYLWIARGLDWLDRKVVDGAVNGLAWLGEATARASDWFDRTYIDGVVNRVSLDTIRGSLTLRRIQTGRVQNYGGMIAIGMALLILAVFIAKVVAPLFGGG